MTTAPRTALVTSPLTNFDDNAHHIAKRQYVQESDEGLSGMFERIASWVAGAEAPEARLSWAQKYYDLMAGKKFCPGGRVLAGAGTRHGNVLNCFVQGATEHAPASFDGVMEVAKKLALVTKVGGGNGVNLDVYTPRAATSRPDAGVRGWAYMAASHPDVSDFIEGLMRPPTQPDGDKQPVAIRNWTRVVYGAALSPELVALARQNGVQIVRGLPEGVQGVPDDMGGIIDAARSVAESAKLNLEPRLDLSHMRPEGAAIQGSGGTSSGPVSFLMEIFDNFLEWANRGAEQSGPINTLRYVYSPVLRVVRQGGTRRGAGMATISVSHPDVLDFLTAKDLDREASEGDISTFNISILVSVAFWDTLQANAIWPLAAQEVPGKYYLAEQPGEFAGKWPELPDRAEDGARGVPMYQVGDQTGIPAAWLWDQVAQHAWSTGEPGLIFVDRINEYSALKNLGERYQIRSTNPCVTAETWVSTAMGARQVSDLIGKDFCATVNGQSFNAPGGFWLTGIKPVLKVRTKRGYELRLTENHRLLKVTQQTRDEQRTEWAETGSLATGDRIMLSDHRSTQGWAGRGNHSEGWLLGSLIGDGTFITDKARPMAALGFWGDERIKVADQAEARLRALDQSAAGSLKKLWRGNDEARNRIRISSEALAELAAKFGVVHRRKTLTDQIEQGGYEFYRGVLQGLFDADGGVQGNRKNGVNVRLAQSDLALLGRVQRMLARLGILSTLLPERRAAGRALPDGKGGLSEYNVKAQHELLISGSNLQVFAEQVGFGEPRKAALLAEHLAGYTRILNRERFSDEIVSIEPDGEAAVYDVTVEEVHAFDANCILAHNCGEIPLTVGEPCDLGAINLAAYVQDSHFDFQTFREDTRTCVRFLDDVLDVNVFALEDNRVASQDLRRLGLGVMGLADALIKLGLRYDNEAGREMIYDIMSALREEAVAESERLGAERGHYAVYQRHEAKMPHAPRRNVAVLTVAPTGTTSMLMGVSSGIEPVFSPFIWRKIGSEYRALLAPLFVELLESYPPAPNMERAGKWDWDKVTEAVSENHGSAVGLSFIPDALQQVFVCAHDIAPLEHVRMQGAVQRAFDEEGFAGNSLSKTINLPNSATVQDVQDAYSEAYRTGCKGITVYRDGSRQFQVLSTSKTKKKEDEQPEPAQTAAAEVMAESVTPEVVPASTSPAAPAAAIQPRYERPARLQGITDMVKLTDPTSGHRRSFLVTVNHLQGNPVEVMVISGRAGDEANADSEALGRVVSIALQHGVPAEALIKTLRGINGGLYGSYNGRLVGSKADLIAVALESFAKNLDFKNLPPLSGGSSDDLSAAQPGLFATSQGVSTEAMARERCPVCEERAVIREEGCLKCQACGYSKCG